MFKRMSKLFVMGTLVSCGAGKSTTPSSSVKGVSGLETKNVNELANKVIFNCGQKDKDCPDSYGLILNGKNRRAEDFHCSGFFVSKDTIATSTACIKDSYVQSQDICSKNFAVKDIYNNTALCEKVLYKAETSKSVYKSDFALIKLDRELNVTPVDIAGKGFSTYKTYSYWRAVKSYQNDVFELKKTEYCRPTRKNVVFPEGTTGNDKTVAFKNCKVEKGDLGAALIDNSNKVTGVIWGDQKRTREYDRFMGGKAGRSLMYASPMSCIVSQLESFFPEVELSESAKKDCKVQRNRYSTTQFFKTLTSLFFDSKKSAKHKIVNIKHNTRSSMSFYRIDHDKCLDSEFSSVDICEFYPSLYTSYEIRRKNLDNCYKTKRVKYKILKNLWGSYDLSIISEYKKVSSFEIPACK